MGKQSKRKNKRKGNKHHRPTGLADDPAVADVDAGGGGGAAANNESSPVAKIISKIRHGDPRVRHASLVALSRTLYDGNALEHAASAASAASSGKKKSANNNNSAAAAQANNTTLLKALSEKILDVDVPCATTAVGCLSNYVTFYCGSSDDGGSGGIGGEEEDVPSDVMVPIFMQRLQNSLGTLRLMNDQLVKMMQQNSNTIKKEGNIKGGSSKKEGKGSSKSNTPADNTPNNNLDKLLPKISEQWTLLSLSLSTLASLIENCPRAHERCGAHAFVQLVDCVDLGMSSLNLFGTSTGTTAVGGLNVEKKRKEVEKPILEALTNATRAFHSLVDDNSTLVASLPLGSVTSAIAAASASSTNHSSSIAPTLHLAVSQLTKLITIGTDNGNNINNGNNSNNINITAPTMMAKLHASGSILSLRRILVLESELVNATADEEALVNALQSCANDVIVPLLSTLFASSVNNNNNDGNIDGANNSSTKKQLLNQMIFLSNQISKIQTDKLMEDQIVNEVNARKEPAREIARRQKKMKEDKMMKQDDGVSGNGGGDGMEGVQTMKEEKDGALKEENVAAVASAAGAGTGAAMLVEDNESAQDDTEQTKNEQQQQQQAAEDELKDELNEVVASWKDIVGSHKLALELVANLCSGGGDDDDEGEEEGDMGGMYEDEDEHMWDSDDEANLLASASANNPNAPGNNNTMIHPCELAMYDSMATKHHLPENILRFFCGWIHFLSGTNENVPALVTQDVNEILATCALCLGNIVALDHLSTWKTSNGVESFWNGLISLLPSNNANDDKADWKQAQHVSSVILSMLQHQPPSRRLVNEVILSGLIAMLVVDKGDNTKSINNNSSNGKSMEENDAMVQTHCNIIAMFGVLCSEPHPASVNSVVCHALVQRLQSASTDDHSTGSNNDSQMKHSVIVCHEIFNVLMDMYGSDEDDAHAQVFEKECVLDHFRRMLPGFKRRIKEVAATATAGGAGGGASSVSVSVEERGVWNETALNVSRFIKYKSGGN